MRFGLVGVVAVAADAALLHIGLLAGVSPLAARIVSLSACVVVTWALNRRFTFRSDRAPSWSEFGSYVVAAAIGIALNYGAYALVVLAGGAPVAGLGTGAALAALVNFLSFRRLLAPAPVRSSRTSTARPPLG